MDVCWRVGRHAGKAEQGHGEDT
jgi:hypothetical protein